MGHMVALVNIQDGSVQGHKAGCADLKRGNLRRHADDVWEMEVDSKADARATYNADFDYDTDGWYEIEWAPCAKRVPEGDIAEFLTDAEPEPVSPFTTDEAKANARENFAHLANHAGTESARKFWQAKADAL